VKPTYLLDANIIIRLLRNDHAVHSVKATALFKRAATGEIALEITAVTAAEVVYVFQSLYKAERARTADAVLRVLGLPGVSDAHAPWLASALELYRDTHVDAPDCFLAAQAKHAGKSMVSFDRDFKKFPDVTTISP
jgi:predicted nucleic acid-binding protein